MSTRKSNTTKAASKPRTPKTDAPARKPRARKRRADVAADSVTTVATADSAAIDESLAEAESYPSLQQIAERAYYRYLERGATHGHDLEDWVAAQQDLTGTFG